MLRLLLFMLGLVAGHTLFAQGYFEGRITDTANQPIASATVTLIHLPDSLVLSFAFSDSKGLYRLWYTDSISANSHLLKVSATGFEPQYCAIGNNRTTYNFLLKHSLNELLNVTVVNKPRLQQNGDTLSYNVQSFAKEEDRSIGDVIKRLPGVAVAEDGTISVNGKTIRNLVIQGDDLMDGRYGAATKIISKDMIKSVEVIEHYQDVKALKGKVYSDATGINLTLKDENAWALSKQAVVGGGAPNAINLKQNLILLNKKVKTLTIFNYNTIGTDYQNDFKNLYNTSNEEASPAILTDEAVGNPPVSNRYIYRNKSFFGTNNFLYNTKDSLQIRANTHYFIDKNRLDYQSTIQNFAVTDTVNYYEKQHLVQRPYDFSTSITLLKNTDATYFKNQTEYGLAGSSNTGDLDFNGNSFGQTLATRGRKFTNQLQWIPSLFKKAILSVNWFLLYENRPQQLYIGSGANKEILNDSIAYRSSLQTWQVPTTNNKVTATYYPNSRYLIKQAYEVGTQQQWQRLQSFLSLEQLSGTNTATAIDSKNDLRWRRDIHYCSSRFWAKKEYWNASLTIPLTLQQITLQEDFRNTNLRQRNLFINPLLQSELFLGGKNSFSLTYNYTNNFGMITDIFRGAVLASFRDLRNNETFIQERQVNDAVLQYRFKDPIKIFFFNATVRYRAVTTNAVLSSIFLNNVQRTIYLPLENRQKRIAYSFNASKYVFPLKSKFELEGSYSIQRLNQYLNGRFVPFVSREATLNFAGSYNIAERLFANYNANGNLVWNKQQSATATISSTLTKVSVLSHNLSLEYTPARFPLYCRLQARERTLSDFQASKSSFFFADMFVRWKIKKWHSDIEMELNNIMNTKNFNSYYNFINQLITTNYVLRGRTIIISATFNF